MQRRTRVICVGHSAWDRSSFIDRFPASPTKVTAQGVLESGGGMAANAAVTIARLGADAEFWGPVGTDRVAEDMSEELSGYGVNVTQMRRITGARSSVSTILVDARGERLIVNHRSDALSATAGWLPLARIAEAHALYADVRWLPGARAALTRARAYGVPSVLDCEIAELASLEALVPLADFAIFSEAGLARWTGSDAPEERVTGLRAAVEAGAAVAGVTLGAEGSAWLAGGEFFHVPAPRVSPVDTTGAGDAFHGAFALALAEGRPLDWTIRLASAVAALKCTGRGSRASIPTRDQAESFMLNTYGPMAGPMAGPTARAA